MTEPTPKKPIADEPEVLELEEVLADRPPGTVYAVARLASDKGNLVAPPVRLHCESEECGRSSLFDSKSSTYIRGGWAPALVRYTCRHCGKRGKTFALFLNATDDGSGAVLKFGEYPEFGPPIPSRVVKLIAPDRDLFLRGMRAETQGLGIGAFAYYRRVVENQKDRLFDEIIRVATRTSCPQAIVDALKRARGEQQFTRAVEIAKDALPPALLIKGHNPLTLLHSALSHSLHVESEERCLELASSIRIVLFELADRSRMVLKDEQELSTAVSRLLKPKTTNGEAVPPTQPPKPTASSGATPEE